MTIVRCTTVLRFASRPKTPKTTASHTATRVRIPLSGARSDMTHPAAVGLSHSQSPQRTCHAAADAVPAVNFAPESS